eukprot:gene45006-56024_t
MPSLLQVTLHETRLQSGLMSCVVYLLMHFCQKWDVVFLRMEEHPAAREFRHHPLPFYQELSELFMNRIATGEFAVSSASTAPAARSQVNVVVQQVNQNVSDEIVRGGDEDEEDGDSETIQYDDDVDDPTVTTYGVVYPRNYQFPARQRPVQITTQQTPVNNASRVSNNANSNRNTSSNNNIATTATSSNLPPLISISNSRSGAGDPPPKKIKIGERVVTLLDRLVNTQERESPMQQAIRIFTRDYGKNFDA